MIVRDQKGLKTNKMTYLRNVATLALDPSLCAGCGMCEIVCPQAVFDVRDGLARIVARDSCMECGACARNCPENAITVRVGVGCAQGILASALGIDTCCSVKTAEPCCSPVKPTCVPSPGRDPSPCGATAPSDPSPTPSAAPS